MQKTRREAIAAGCGKVTGLESYNNFLKTSVGKLSLLLENFKKNLSSVKLDYFEVIEDDCLHVILKDDFLASELQDAKTIHIGCFFNGPDLEGCSQLLTMMARKNDEVIKKNSNFYIKAAIKIDILGLPVCMDFHGKYFLQLLHICS